MSSEFEVLIQTICNPLSAVIQRQQAESTLFALLSNLQTWFHYLPLILTAPDNVCFFIGIGLQRLVWRHWEDLDDQGKKSLIETIHEVLLKRNLHMQSFAIVKLEQVLAVISIQSKTFDPVIHLIAPYIGSNNQITLNTIIGLSAIRTSLDFILSEDPKISQKDRNAIITIIQSNGLLLTLTNISCHLCTNAMQNYNEETFQAMRISLDFIKTIVSKLPLGPHVSIDVLLMLFSIAESGADTRSMFHQSALIAIETLSEVMNKKYVPAGGVSILLKIVSKTVSLLKSFRENGRVDDSPIVLNLLEFISVFSYSQLERCVSFTYGITGSTKPEIAKLQQSISEFFNELVTLTTISTDPEVLSKVVAVWNGIMTLDNVKVMVLENMQAVIVPILAHLIRACLTQSNSDMGDHIEDLIEDLKIDVLVDPHIKEILFNANTLGLPAYQQKKNDEDILGVEEYTFMGSSLIAETHDFISEIATSDELKQWMQPMVEQLSSQCTQTIISSSCNVDSQKVVVDMLFLLRLLPISAGISENASIALAGNLLEFTKNIMDSGINGRRSFFQQKECIVLQLRCYQIVGQMIPKVLIISSSVTSTSGDLQWQEFLQQALRLVFSQITVNLSLTEHLADTQFGSVILSLTILFMQLITSLQNVFLSDTYFALQQEISSMLFPCIQYSQQQTSLLEVYVLLICCQEMLQPSTVTPQAMTPSVLVNQLIDLYSKVSSTIGSSDWSLVEGQLEGLVRMLASLDALTRHHSLSSTARRQMFITSISILQTHLTGIATLVMNLQFQVWKYYVARRYGASITENTPAGVNSALLDSVSKCSKLVISLCCSFLQSLGRKSFGNIVFEVFGVCVSFVEMCSSASTMYSVSPTTVQSISSYLSSVHNINPMNGLALVLFDHSGCKLVGSVLELCQIMAESTPSNSPTSTDQVAATHRLIMSIMRYFSDERLCGELLQPTLRSGITAIKCYWTKSQKLGFSPIGGAEISSSVKLPGENVSILVQSLVQLCVGSLGNNVPPQDTLLALEGMLSLKEQHNIFVIEWFQQDCWGILFNPCLRAVVLHMHNSHSVQLESVFLTLCDSKVQHIKKSNDISNVALLEFWNYVCQEVVKIATEYGCGEKCHSIIASAINQCTASTGGNQQSLLADTAFCLKELILPAGCIISRHS